MISDYYTQSIVIQRKTLTANNFGGKAETWSTHLTINGYIDMLSGRELEKAKQNNAQSTHVLMCATEYDITNNDRVFYDSKIYRVITPKDEVFSHHAEILLSLEGVDVL